MITISKKICLLGDFAVGKTSLIHRFVYNMFEDRYLSTIGVEVSRKVVVVPAGESIVELVLMVWDLAGSEVFNQVRQSYLRGAAGAVLVCDLTRPETLDSLPGYVDDIRRVNPHAHFALAANKVDQAQQQISEAQVAAAAAQLGMSYHLTSAALGSGVEDVVPLPGPIAGGLNGDACRGCICRA